MMGDMTMEEIVPAGGDAPDPGFPDAPPGWTQQTGRQTAADEGIAPGPDHWEAVRALQALHARYSHGGHLHFRVLHDALEERFHAKGGLRYVYGLFPGGPVAQGCRIAGLPVPAGAIDRGFGSVV